MSVEDTAVYENILELVDKSEPPAYYRWVCSFVMGDDIDDIDAVSVDSITITRDYQECFSDISTIEVSVPAGTFTYQIYPNKNNLIVHLTREQITSKGEDIPESDTLNVIRKRATIYGSGSPAVTDYGDISDDLETLNHANVISITMQLTDPVIEAAKQTICNAIFHDTNVESLLLTVLKQSDDPNLSVDGIDIYPPTNERVYNHVIIYPGTQLTDIPDAIQDNYGIYTSGIGSFIQNNIWFLFPIYRTNIFNESDHKMTIISVPEDKYAGSEKTYSLEDDQLYILACGKTIHSDDTDYMVRNVGNGVLYQNASRVVDKYSSTIDGITTIHKDKNIIKYISHDRDDEASFTPYYKKISTSNHCLPPEIPVLSNTGILVITWNNGDPDLIYPGMAIKYLYREGEDILSIYGIVVEIKYESAAKDRGVLQDIHSNSIIIGMRIGI